MSKAAQRSWRCQQDRLRKEIARGFMWTLRVHLRTLQVFLSSEGSSFIASMLEKARQLFGIGDREASLSEEKPYVALPEGREPGYSDILLSLSSAFMGVYTSCPGDFFFRSSHISVAKFLGVPIKISTKPASPLQHTVMVQTVMVPPEQVLFTRIATDESSRLWPRFWVTGLNLIQNLIQPAPLISFF